MKTIPPSDFVTHEADASGDTEREYPREAISGSGAKDTNRILWIVGKVVDYETNSWEYIGVFDSECKAVSACITVQYFVGPTELNTPPPDETAPWKDGYYPLRLWTGKKGGGYPVERETT